MDLSQTVELLNTSVLRRMFTSSEPVVEIPIPTDHKIRMGFTPLDAGGRRMDFTLELLDTNNQRVKTPGEILISLYPDGETLYEETGIMREGLAEFKDVPQDSFYLVARDPAAPIPSAQVPT